MLVAVLKRRTWFAPKMLKPSLLLLLAVLWISAMRFPRPTGMLNPSPFCVAVLFTSRWESPVPWKPRALLVVAVLFVRRLNCDPNEKPTNVLSVLVLLKTRLLG